MTDDLRAALESAMVGMTEDQARRARDLLAALTPPMEEPTWPGAPVIAGCSIGGVPSLHTRRNNGPDSEWECEYYCTAVEWDLLVNPRPLTPAEYAEYGIPAPCTHVEDEAIEHERRPRCYIAGPIAYTAGARERFTDAMGTVEALGYEPINPFNVTPAKHDGECPPGYNPGEGKHDHTSSACYMRADLAALLTCDAIYMLHGWQESRGATVEHDAAVACGMTILGARA